MKMSARRWFASASQIWTQRSTQMRPLFGQKKTSLTRATLNALDVALPRGAVNVWRHPCAQ
eukprot:400792-Lingulodinium_polyedra.AAC.1